MLWMLLQTLMSPAAIARDAVPAEPVAVSAPVAASATNVNADSVTPKINDMKIDIATACAIPTYPEAALRYGMQGDTVLKLMIDESGKIKAFQLVRSSGWKMLDLTVMNAIIGCQILPEGRWVPSETYTAYRWKFDQGYTSPAVLEAKTCKSSDKLRIADDRDNKNCNSNRRPVSLCCIRSVSVYAVSDCTDNSLTNAASRITSNITALCS